MPNRLAHESSPYLRQHQDNPVDWFPWGDEALARAKAEDRPILLSVGYSACHWCHVMEHESFSDPGTAARMNTGFVNIKVDREERPDLDEIYMRAVQAFTGGRGGWPMTVFLTPDGEPFYGGTYFPPEPRHGMPSFRQILDHANTVYERIRTGDEDVHHRVMVAVKDDDRFGRGEAGRTDWLDKVAAAADASFDARDGGFGRAPKFPAHGTLGVLLAHHVVTGRSRSLTMATTTLDAMIRGALYDHLGGGFARYSVDGEWRVPHFEKMLYDNAQLVPRYVEAYRLTGDPTYARIARETCDYLLRDMRSDDGLFFAAEDADSEGEEGLFYVFDREQLSEALGEEDGDRAADLLQVTVNGTFEHGASVLRLDEPLERMDPADAAFLRDVAFPRLREVQATRIRPHRDDKVITAWNGLAISAFASAGRTLDPTYVEVAVTAAERLLDVAFVDGRLHRIVHGEAAKVPAFLDDHADLLLGLLDLWEATWDARWIAAAERLADAMLALFDGDADPLFYTGHDAETLVARSHRLLAGAEPSGNAAAALGFARLAVLAGRDDLGTRADRILTAYAPLADRAPLALGESALAGHWRATGGLEIGVIRTGGPASHAVLDTLASRALPFAVTCVQTPDEGPKVPWMADRPLLDDAEVTVYVCQGFACQLPVTDADALTAQLDALQRPRKAPASPSPHLVRAPAWSTDPADWLNAERPLSLQELRGHVVVLDFWTFCCINCMHVLPELEAVERHFAGQPVVVLGVHSAKFDHEKVRPALQAAIERYGIHHPVINDPSHALWQQYAVRSWPTVAVIDAHGRIAWQRGGEIDRETLIQSVQELLDEARDAGVLATTPVWRPSPSTAPPMAPTALRFPGKVLVSPGPVDRARGANPFDDGRLYIADTGHDRILECALSLKDGWPHATLLRTLGRSGDALTDGPADHATLQAPQGMAELDGALYIADTGHHAVRRVDLASGTVSTVLGTGELGRGGAEATALRSPWDVEAVDGVLFIAMAGTHQIWLHLLDGRRTGPFLGSGREHHIDGPPAEAALAQPSALQVWGNLLFFVDSETSSVRAYDFEKRTVGTLVGEGLFDFGDVDGPRDRVLLQHPLGLAVTGGEVWIADSYNGKVKRLDLPETRVSTVASGLGEPGGLDLAGAFVIVADTNHHRIVAVHRETGELREVPVSAS